MSARQVLVVSAIWTAKRRRWTGRMGESSGVRIQQRWKEKEIKEERVSFFVGVYSTSGKKMRSRSVFGEFSRQ